MPRGKKTPARYVIYDNNIKMRAVDHDGEILPALALMGFECAVRCESFIVPDTITYMALKVNPVRGTREVHHVFVVKE